MTGWLDRLGKLVGSRLDPSTPWGFHLRRLRAKLPPGPTPWVMTRFLEAFAQRYPDAWVVQIGSNDGLQLDPLRRHLLARRWAAVLVEPVPYVHRRLEENTRRLRRVRTANVAVGETDGRAVFFHLRERADGEPELPRWYDALGSFDRSVLDQQESLAGLRDRIVATEVPTLTFETLCRRYGVPRIDLLHIDTEGFDWRVLRQVDLDRWAPRVLLYESHLLGEDREVARRHVESAGYVTFDEGIDTLCLRLEGPDRRDRELVALFERLTRAVRP